MPLGRLIVGNCMWRGCAAFFTRTGARVKMCHVRHVISLAAARQLLLQ
jgi:hypothetical protein